MIDVWSKTVFDVDARAVKGETTMAGTRGPSRWNAGSGRSSSAAGGGTWS